MSKANKRGQDLTEHARAQASPSSSPVWDAVKHLFTFEDEDGVEDRTVVDIVDAMVAAGGLTHLDIQAMALANVANDMLEQAPDMSRRVMAGLRITVASVEAAGEAAGGNPPVGVPAGMQAKPAGNAKLAVANGTGGLFIVGEDVGDDI